MAAVPIEPGDNKGEKVLNINRYGAMKAVSQGMLDIALFTANASQLKYVLQTKGQHPFYTLVLTLLGISITLQVTAGISILYSATFDVSKRKHYRKANLLNLGITVQIFFITIVNIVIIAFGIDEVKINPVCSE